MTILTKILLSSCQGVTLKSLQVGFIFHVFQFQCLIFLVEEYIFTKIPIMIR